MFILKRTVNRKLADFFALKIFIVHIVHTAAAHIDEQVIDGRIETVKYYRVLLILYKTVMTRALIASAYVLFAKTSCCTESAL